MAEETRLLNLVWFFLLSVIALLLPILLRPTATTFCSVCPLGSVAVCGVGSSLIGSLPILNNITTSEITGSTIIVTNGNTITTKGEVRFEEVNGTNYVGFLAPNAVTGSVTWRLPGTDGTSGQFLQTDGVGNLTWASAGGGGGVAYGQYIPNIISFANITVTGGLTADYVQVGDVVEVTGSAEISFTGGEPNLTISLPVPAAATSAGFPKGICNYMQTPVTSNFSAGVVFPLVSVAQAAELYFQLVGPPGVIVFSFTYISA